MPATNMARSRILFLLLPLSASTTVAAAGLKGYTEGSCFPTTEDALTRSCNGGTDGIATRMSTRLDTIVTSTDPGGSAEEAVMSPVLYTEGSLVSAGGPATTDLPATIDSCFGIYFSVEQDGFLTVLDLSLSSDSSIAPVYLSSFGCELAQPFIIFLAGNHGLAKSIYTRWKIA